MKPIHFDCKDCKIKNQSLFKHLSDERLAPISDHKLMREFPKGEVVFTEETAAGGIYCIHSGVVKLTSCNSTNGKNAILGIVHQGDVLGHHHLFENKNHRTTATAMADSKICYLEKSFVLKLIESEPSVAQ